MSASEFWLTIPRASRRPDPTRAGAECVVYEVTCALHVENARTRRSESTAEISPATASTAVDVDALPMSSSMNAIERVTKRRYREFVALRDDLEVECGRDLVPELPPRRMFQRVNASDEKVEERRRKLEGWLWALLAIEGCARSEALARFVRLGACERALRRVRDASSIRSGKSAVESPGMSAVSPISSMRPVDTPDSSRSAESNGKRVEHASSDQLGATATVDATVPNPIKEAGESMKETLKVSREMSSNDAMLEELRAEMAALRDELKTTHECLNDARATTCAAESKFKELEARTHKEKKVLSKEIRSLRKQLEAAQIDSNEQANIISAEERTAALGEIMHEVSVLRSRVHECTYEKLISEDSGGDPNELLSVSDNRLAVLLAEAQILIVGMDETAPAASTTTAGAEAETTLMHTEREVRQTFADLLSDLINTRKSINSLLRKVAKKNENGDVRVGTGISSRVGNLVGAIEKKLTIPQ